MPELGVTRDSIQYGVPVDMSKGWGWRLGEAGLREQCLPSCGV